MTDELEDELDPKTAKKKEIDADLLSEMDTVPVDEDDLLEEEIDEDGVADDEIDPFKDRFEE